MPTLTPLETDGLADKLSWHKPERKDQAGRVVIFGGASLKLKSVDLIYKKVINLGSTPSVLIPETLSRGFKLNPSILQPIKFDNYFGLTEQGQKTLSEEFAMADALVLADSGKNSSTANRLAQTVAHSFKPVIITEGSLNLIFSYLEELLHNSYLIIFLSPASLQKIQKALKQKVERLVSLNSGAAAKLKSLLELQNYFQARLVLLEDKLVLAVDEESSTYIMQKTKLSEEQLAASLACWQIWAPKVDFLSQLYISSQS